MLHSWHRCCKLIMFSCTRGLFSQHRPWIGQCSMPPYARKRKNEKAKRSKSAAQSPLKVPYTWSPRIKESLPWSKSRNLHPLRLRRIQWRLIYRSRPSREVYCTLKTDFRTRSLPWKRWLQNWTKVPPGLQRKRGQGKVYQIVGIKDWDNVWRREHPPNLDRQSTG